MLLFLKGTWEKRLWHKYLHLGRGTPSFWFRVAVAGHLKRSRSARSNSRRVLLFLIAVTRDSFSFERQSKSSVFLLGNLILSSGSYSSPRIKDLF